MTKEILGMLLDDIQKAQAVWLIDSLLFKARLNINREMIINYKGSASKIGFSLDMIQRKKEGSQTVMLRTESPSDRNNLGFSALYWSLTILEQQSATATIMHYHTLRVSHGQELPPTSWHLGSPKSRCLEGRFHCVGSFLCLQESTTLFCELMNSEWKRAQVFWWIILEGTDPFRIGEHPSDFI